MTWQEEYKRIMAERQAEQEQLKAKIADLHKQLDTVRGTFGALDTIGAATFGRAA